jgi:hypothetical protein
MARMMLSLDNLHDFDCGKADAIFRQCLLNAVRDLLDRPGDKNARKVVLQITLKPVLQQDGDVVDAEVEFEAKNSLRSYRTAIRPMAIDRRGNLFFNPDSPDNPDQRTIDEEIERNAE